MALMHGYSHVFEPHSQINSCPVSAQSPSANVAVQKTKDERWNDEPAVRIYTLLTALASYHVWRDTKSELKGRRQVKTALMNETGVRLSARLTSVASV